MKKSKELLEIMNNNTINYFLINPYLDIFFKNKYCNDIKTKDEFKDIHYLYFRKFKIF